MPARLITAAMMLGLVAGCAAPPPEAQPLAAGPLNSEPWVSTQYPAGTQGSSSPQLPFQTPNSLPRGAVNTPGR